MIAFERKLAETMDRPAEAPSISVVVPVFRSAPLLPSLVQRLTAALDAEAQPWEVILVDDASPDDSYAVMRQLRSADPRVRIVQLARNHGTDMVNAAMRELAHAGAAGEVANLVFAINRITGRDLDLVLGEGEPAQPPVATLRFESGGARQHAILVERTEEPRGRYAYDEDSLRARCRIDAGARSIVLEARSPFTPVETIVAMTKALHLALFSDKAAAWLFGRLEAPRWPPARFQEGVTITLGHALGTRLTKSRVSLGEETLAWIYFALKEAN